MDDFDIIKQHIKSSSSSIDEITDVFASYKKLRAMQALSWSDFAEDSFASDETFLGILQQLSFSSTIISKANLHLERYCSHRKIDSLVTEPLAEFKKYFSLESKSALKQARKTRASLSKSSQQTGELQNTYFQYCVKAEKAARMAELEDDPQRVELASKNAQELEILADKAGNEYFAAIAKEKQIWTEYEQSRKALVKLLMHMESSRICFIRNALDKFMKQQKEMLDVLNQEFAKITCKVENLEETETVMTSFLKVFKSAPAQEWISYDNWKTQLQKDGEDPIMQEESYILSSIPYTPMSKDLALIKSVIYTLVPRYRKSSMESLQSESQSSVSYSEENGNIDLSINTLSAMFMKKPIRNTFLDLLEERKVYPCLESANLKKLAGLIVSFLTCLKSDTEYDSSSFTRIVYLSHDYHMLEVRKELLADYIMNHSSFLEPQRWMAAIQFLIKDKLRAEITLFKKNKRLRTTKKFQKEKAKKNSTVQLLDQITYYMINLNVPLNVCTDVVLQCTTKVSLPASKVHHILIDLMGKQKTKLVPQAKSSLMDRSRERKIWGDFLPIGLALSYLNKSDLASVLFVNKKWYRRARDYVLRINLTLYRMYNCRASAWFSILNPSKKINYRELLQTRNASIQQVEDIIAMDIFRSYASCEDVDTQCLKNILHAYAVFDPEIQYCQGMNFLAGTLYRVLKDEEKAFRAMVGMIQKFAMNGLYKDKLPKLRMHFFVLDRLITHFLPDVRVTFNTEMIGSSHFASSWFITLYAAMLNSNPKILFELWDSFVYKGWKFIYQISLGLIHKFKHKILYRKLEEILMLMTTLQSPFSNLDTFSKGFIEECTKFKVTRKMIKSIEDDYGAIKAYCP